MGDARTIVGLLQQIFGRHTYSMEASFDVIESDKSKIAADYQTSYDRSEDPKVVNENEPSGEVVDSIPPLSEPVPENWTTVNGDISVFLTSKVPWLARGMLSHPYCMPNDGLLDLMLIRNGAGIGQQLDVFTKLEKGKHISSDIVSMGRCKYDDEFVF
jgi:sphingosine kinase